MEGEGKEEDGNGNREGWREWNSSKHKVVLDSAH